MSDNVVPGPKVWVDHTRQSLSATLPPRAGASSGADGPRDPGISERVSAVEANVANIKATLTRLETVLNRINMAIRKLEADVAEAKGRIAQMPTAVTLIGFVLAVLAAGGLMRHFFSVA